MVAKVRSTSSRLCTSRTWSCTRNACATPCKYCNRGGLFGSVGLARTAIRDTVGTASLRNSIDLQKMNWKCRTGVNEQMGVSLKRLCSHTSIGGYIHADQDTGQYCHCSSLAHAVATGLSAR